MRQEIIDWVLASRIVAIIRGFDPEVCLKLADAYYEGGIRIAAAARTLMENARV